ncbi:MAG: recombinase family protein [Planctomycetota bacterium]
MSRNKRNGGPSGSPSASATVPLQTVIGYCRVSTLDQVIDGVSLADQEHRIRAYGDAHGLTVAYVVADEGISGKDTKNRPALLKALTALRKGDAAGLVVTKLDRLSRSLKDALDLVARSQREGWELHSISERLDTATAQGRFVVHLFAALAQLEREQIGERTRQGMAEIRRQGKRASRFPPFGYRFEGSDVVPVATEQVALARMRALHDAGYGPASIARTLNAEGLTNPRTGREWTRGNVGCVLGRVLSA